MWIFAVNEKSGGGRGRRAWRIVETELKRLGIAYAAVLAASPEEARVEIARLLREHGAVAKDRAAMDSRQEQALQDERAPRDAQALTKVKAITVVGGDGTIHGLLPVLCGSRVPLGLIPAGSGNDTARAFGIPRRPLEALRLVLQGRALPADVIELRGTAAADQPARPVLTALAAGFDSAIAEAVNRSFYKKLCNLVGAGSLAYIIGLVHVLLTFRPRPLRVTVDGRTTSFQRGWLAAVCNVPAYGGGLRICPDALPDDSRLNVCVVHSCTPLQLLRLFPLLLSGKHVRLPYVTMLAGHTVVVEQSDPDPAGRRPIAVYGDGEFAGTLPLHAQAAGHRIEVLR